MSASKLRNVEVEDKTKAKKGTNQYQISYQQHRNKRQEKNL